MIGGRLADHLDHMRTPAHDARRFVEGMTKQDFPVAEAELGQKIASKVTPATSSGFDNRGARAT